MYIELHAYQHHVFMDWRFVDDSKWEVVNSNLNGAGVESMVAKWDEMFKLKEEEVVMEVVKIKKPRKKAALKKDVTGKKIASGKSKAVTKPAAKKLTVKKPVIKTKDVKPKAAAKKVVKKPIVKKTSSK